MSLIKNSSLNIVGAIVPAIIAIPAIGFLARTLGVERFGLLTLAWALVGYATLFDLGLSRAVSQYVAKHAGAPEKARVALGSASCAVIVSGAVVAFVLWALAALLTDHVFNVSPEHRQDAIDGVRILGLSIPLLLASLIVQGFLEGRELFFESNVQKTVAGSLVFVMPVVCVWLAPTFYSAIAGLCIARFLAFILSIVRCNAIEPVRAWTVERVALRQLVSYGGGVALTNTISPIMGYLDRFLLSSMHGAQFVGHYTAAAELVSRLAIVPVAISRALFPKLVTAVGNERHEGALVRKARLYTAVTCLPPALLIFLLAEELLRIWLGAEMSRNSSGVLQILIIGFVFNAFAQIPFSQIQARGQSYLTAKIQLYEVVPYIVLLFLLGRARGAEGVAMAWTIRIIADFIIMEIFSRRPN